MAHYIISYTVYEEKQNKSKRIRLNYLSILLSNWIKITMLKIFKILTLKIINKVLMMMLF